MLIDNVLQQPSTGAFGHSVGLSRTADADRGVVEVPMLAPHLESRPAGDEAVLLASETASAALYGKLYADLVPLIDGVRSRGEIVAALGEAYPVLAVQTTLVSMAAKGYIVSAEFDMNMAAAAFWSTLGVSPRWAEDRLRASRVAVTGDDGRLAAALGEMGLAVNGADPTLVAVVVDDYLAEGNAEINREHLASGAAWVPVKARGVWPLFGPVFRPLEGGPCWACLAHRLRGNREVESFLRAAGGEAAALAPRAGVAPFENAMHELAATEIAKWIVLSDLAPLHEHAVALDFIGAGGGYHQVMRRPQCFACGEKDLHRPDRPAAPVVLGPSPKPVRNSGGMRSVPAAETVQKYRHLVSPISGVVTQLFRVTDNADPWLHVYWAGSNLALKGDSFYLLRNSIRTKSSGKGSSDIQAAASALCEAVERYSGVYHGDEIRRRARLSDFAPGEAIHPNDVQLYSDRQYENAEAFNALGSRFNYVPERFDPDVEMDWTPVWSFTAGRHRYLPTSMLYFAAPMENGVVYCGPDSNGCAAGNTLEEAILQGFFELVERDAFSCWWYNRAVRPEVDLDGFDDPFLSSAREHYAAHNRELWMLDLTNDLGIPVFAAVSRRTDKEAEDILYAAGAHFDAHIAALRAMCELNQYFGGVRDAAADGTGYLWDDPESLWWWRTAKLADNLWLAPAPGAAARGGSCYTVPETADVREDVELCRSLVERKGMEFLVLDQTRPDIGMPVAKTIVPGLRHFWRRTGLGRLYDVPVEIGWLDAPTAEGDLNPVSVFI